MAELKLIPSMDAKLIRWAEFVSQSAGQSTGANIIAKAMASGGMIVRATNPDIGSLPDDVYDLGKLIEGLEKNLRVVVHEHYLNVPSMLEQRLKACGCSNGTYYRRLSKAHYALLYLSKRPSRKRTKLSTV
ncbi:hypothetical protein WN093_12135 [Gammaproteobacteria bacterium AS21]